jgi:hypothetical protein
MVGQDGRTYETTVEAASLFDAADRALQQWARFVVVSAERVCRSADGRQMLEGERGARQRVAQSVEVSLTPPAAVRSWGNSRGRTRPSPCWRRE